MSTTGLYMYAFTATCTHTCALTYGRIHIHTQKKRNKQINVLNATLFLGRVFSENIKTHTIETIACVKTAYSVRV